MARFDKLEFDAERPLSAELDLVDSVDAGDWLKRAHEQRINGSYDTAMRLYSRALELDKKLPQAWVGQIQMLIAMAHYDQALLWSKKTLEYFPQHADLLAAQAQAHCRRGDMKAANASIDAAFRTAGESAYMWQVRGEVMIANRQPTDRHCFDKAQIVDPDPVVPMETAAIYIYHGQWAKAQQRLLRLLEREPDIAQAWYLLGLCQERSGMMAAAGRSYQQAREIHPGHRLASDGGSRVAKGNGIFRKLKALFRRD